MELKRGKTFIKSSLQIAHERAPEPAATALAREDAGSSEKGSHTRPTVHGSDGCPNKEVQSDSEAGPVASGATFKLVRKSKTHESVPGAGRAAGTSGQLVGSASFPGPPGGQRMIDYRHFVPQVPFVPAVAKSIPRKRISLKRPKKCFWNLFHIRRNKTENVAALVAKGKSLSSPRGLSRAAGRRGTTLLPLGEDPGLDGLCHDLSDGDLLLDSSFDLCRALCEDVASLKSFDSLTGCGEIFADESSVPSLELSDSPESPARVSQAPESKTPGGPFQGGVEKLASPAQNEVSDFTRFWDSVNRSVRQQHRALLGPWLAGPQGTDTGQPRLDTAELAELPLCPCRDPPSGSKASSIDTGTPKSEQPESVSTSDEGYYDSFSPGLEEDKKEAPSPGTPAATFPRDSYSGDALYELFYDPSESPVGPSLDDDLCVSESLSGPALGTPLSMCSFHVGAEENLAPAPGPDLLSQGFLQSSWKGKECLLKLCDTELAITMGIVNWLRRGPEPRTQHAAAPAPASAPGESAPPLGPQKAPGGLVQKQEGRADWASETRRATVCSGPSRQALWVHSGTKGLPAGDSTSLTGAMGEMGTLPRDPFLEEGRQDHSDGRFSSVGSVATAATTDASNKSKTPAPPAWPSLQKEPQPPGNLGCSQDPRRPDQEGSTLEAEPVLTGCVARVAALQIDADSQSPVAQPLREAMGSGLFGQPQAMCPENLQQDQLKSSPSKAAARGLPSPASLQDQGCADFIVDLSQFTVEPVGLSPRACASVEDQPLPPSAGAVEQAAQRDQLDSEPPLVTVVQQNSWSHSPEILGLTLDGQWDRGPSASVPRCCCSLLAHEDLLSNQPEAGGPRPAMAEPHL